MWAAAPLGMLAAMASAFGAEGMTLCVGQAALSVLMLEAANYVQHYGLQRTKLDNGRSVYCQHTVNILSAYCQHTVSILSAYCGCNGWLAASVTESPMGTLVVVFCHLTASCCG